MGSWIKQANPDYFDILAAARQLPEITAEIRQHRNEIRVGDRFYYWMTGRDAALVAFGDVLTNPASCGQLPEEKQFNRGDSRFDSTELRVRVRMHPLAAPIPRADLISHPILQS